MNKLHLLSLWLLAIAQITFGYTVTVVNKLNWPITAASCQAWDSPTDRSECLGKVSIAAQKTGVINAPDGTPTISSRYHKSLPTLGLLIIFLQVNLARAKNGTVTKFGH